MANIIRKLFNVGNPQNEEATEVWVEPGDTVTSKILGYFGRINDRAQIRNAIIQRFGTGIKQVSDSTGNTWEVYTREGFEQRALAGHIEVVNVGLGHNIISATATLFTEPGQRFSILSPDGEEITDVAEWLAEFRADSQFIDGMTQVDEESMQLGCSVLWPDFYEGKLRYRTVDPGKIRVRFDQAVESDGQVRPVNYLDIEDATCVIVETGTVDNTYKTYTAVFGRSYKYPNGRHVSYTSEADGKDVPDVGNPDIYDWVNASGEVANPLSQYANEHPDIDLPEYPFVIFYGGHVRRDRLFPLSASLLEESLEADVAASHLRAVSADNARGTLALLRDQMAATFPLPDHLYGEVSLEPGQSIERVDANQDGAKVGWEILQQESVASAAGYGVPDYYVSSEDHTVEAASGVALKIRTGPLIKFRDKRIAINAPSVAKTFEIEKAQIAMFAEGDEAIITKLEAAGQLWDAGEKDLPEEIKDIVETAEKLYSRGVYDDIEYIRVIYRLPTEAEAIAKYEELKARAKKYPPLKEEMSDVMGFGRGQVPGNSGRQPADQASPSRGDGSDNRGGDDR